MLEMERPKSDGRERDFEHPLLVSGDEGDFPGVNFHEFFRPLGGGGRLHPSLKHYVLRHQSELSKGTESGQPYHACQS